MLEERMQNLLFFTWTQKSVTQQKYFLRDQWGFKPKNLKESEPFFLNKIKNVKLFLNSKSI